MSRIERLGRRLDDWTERLAARPQWAFVFVAIFSAVQVGPWFYTAPDGCCYLSIARSLWQADGPRSLGNRFLLYTLGYPILISPTFLLGDRPFVWIGLLHFALAATMTSGIYRWARSFGSHVALFAAVLTATHACFGIYYRRPLSETAFVAGFVWTAIVLDGVRTATDARARWRSGVIGTLLLLATCQIRPNGITLIPGFAAAVVCGAWRERIARRRAIITALIVGAIASAAFLGARALDDRRAGDRGDPTYWDYFTKIQSTGDSVVDRAVEGVRIQMLEFLRLAVPGALKTHAPPQDWLHPNTLLSVIVTLPVVAGWFVLFRRRPDVLAWTTVFYLGLNVLWAADQGGRYTLPVLPVLAVGTALFVLDRRPQSARWLTPYVLLHAAVSLGYWLGIDLPRTREANRQWPDIDAIAAQIDSDHDRVAASGMSGDELNLLCFTLDRQVRKVRDGATVGNDAAWLVTTSAAPPEWIEIVTHGKYRLLRAARRPSQATRAEAKIR